MGLDLITLAVLYAAAARLWHLGATDKLSRPLRDRVPGYVADWLECVKCAGFWAALAAVGAYACTRTGVPDWSTRVVDIVLIALALNWILIASRSLLDRVLAAAAARTAAISAAARAAAERPEWPR